jgi:hypothetical protein
MMDMYNSFDAARARGDFAVLPELHALSSGLKALCTDITAAGIEACRRQCGGHGYMLASGLPTLFNSYVQVCVCGGGGAACVGPLTSASWSQPDWVCRPKGAAQRGGPPASCRSPASPLASACPAVPPPQRRHTPPPVPAPQNCTWEGDNSVMYLQTARYLVKNVLAVQAGKPLSGSARYLADTAAAGARCGVASPEDWRSPAHQRAALTAVAAQLAAQATRVLAAAGGGRVSFEGEAWNGSTVDLIRAARVGAPLMRSQGRCWGPPVWRAPRQPLACCSELRGRAESACLGSS